MQVSMAYKYIELSMIYYNRIEYVAKMLIAKNFIYFLQQQYI